MSTYVKPEDDPRLSDTDRDLIQFLREECDRLLKEYVDTPKWRVVRRANLEDKHRVAASLMSETIQSAKQRAIFESLPR